MKSILIVFFTLFTFCLKAQSWTSDYTVIVDEKSEQLLNAQKEQADKEDSIRKLMEGKISLPTYAVSDWKEAQGLLTTDKYERTITFQDEYQTQLKIQKYRDLFTFSFPSMGGLLLIYTSETSAIKGAYILTRHAYVCLEGLYLVSKPY
jgi:hypothetical protein